jgi:hypothetical protein
VGTETRKISTRESIEAKMREISEEERLTLSLSLEKKGKKARTL